MREKITDFSGEFLCPKFLCILQKAAAASGNSSLNEVQQSQSPRSSRTSDITTTTTLLADSPSAIKQKFAEEVKKREDLQKELGLQVWYRKKSNNTEITSNFENFALQKSMKAEMEMAMKLLEKDVHEKQDTIIALRDQLEDIKNINLEMYTKLQVFIYL